MSHVVEFQKPFETLGQKGTGLYTIARYLEGDIHSYPLGSHPGLDLSTARVVAMLLDRIEDLERIIEHKTL